MTLSGILSRRRFGRNPAGHVAISSSPRDLPKAADPPEKEECDPVMSANGSLEEEDDNTTSFTEQFNRMDQEKQEQQQQPHYYELDEEHCQDQEVQYYEEGHPQNPVSLYPNDTMQSEYSLEAKPTKATLAETFSGEGEYDFQPSHTFSTEEHHNLHTTTQNENYINLADDTGHYRNIGGGTFDTYEDDDRNDEDCRDDYLSNEADNLVASTYSSGAEFMDLRQEAAAVPRLHHRSTVNMHQDDFEKYAESYGLEEEKLIMQETEQEEEGEGIMLQFVDSEDGQAFSFRTSRPEGYGDVIEMPYITEENGGETTPRTDEGLHQDPSSEATSMGYDSKTLNTNEETLHTDLEGVNYIPTMNEHDVVHDPAYQLDSTEGESYDDDEERLAGGFEDIYDSTNNNNNAAGVSIPQTSSYQYEEDGYIRYSEDDHHHHHCGGAAHDELCPQDTYQDSNTEFTKEDATQAGLETQDGDHTEAHMSQIMDSYLSDRSSDSWDEGSYASRSRAVSRLDSFDGTEFTEDTSRDNGLFVHILKNFRDNVQDYRDGNDLDSIDEEDDDGESHYQEDGPSVKKKRTSLSRTSRKSGSRDIGTVLGRIGDIGIDLLNETIEKAEKAEGRSRNRRRSRGRRGGDPAERIMDSFRDIFSCGAPRHY